MSRIRRTTVSIVLTTYAAYLFAFLEWVYFVTKPSFMDSLDTGSKMGFWLMLALCISSVAVPAAILLAQFDGHLPGRAHRLKASLLAPSLVLGALGFLMADNFLYTVTRWGVVRAGVVTRWLWLALFLYLLYRAYRLLDEHVVQWLSGRRLLPHALVGLGLVASSLSYGAVRLEATDLGNAGVRVIAKAEEIRRPNIIFLGADGVEARWLSAYGFHLPTTPFLQRLASQTLVFENAFSNCGKTTGSIATMLTGKLPTEIKVGFPPQVLLRQHGYRHLPALLRRLGYTGFQRGIRWYADAGDVNMVDSFDESNYRSLWVPEPDTAEYRLSYAFNSELMFASRVMERLQQRVLHILGVRRMVDYYLQVKDNEGLGVAKDRETLERAKAFIQTRQGPFFMHLHLMATHCCKYRSIPQHFGPEQVSLQGSLEQREVRAGMLSAIREVDAAYEEFVTWLDQQGHLDNTILVISSDHTQYWDSVQRVPLFIRFPHGEHAGRVRRNVALVDLPATILDYMHVEVPAWMSSRSLLASERDLSPLDADAWLEGYEPIFSLSEFDYKRFFLGGEKLSRMVKPGPPLYGVKKAAVVVCDRWYKLSLQGGDVTTGKVHGHTAPCKPESLPSKERAAAWIRASLERDGFELPP